MFEKVAPETNHRNLLPVVGVAIVVLFLLAFSEISFLPAVVNADGPTTPSASDIVQVTHFTADDVVSDTVSISGDGNWVVYVASIVENGTDTKKIYRAASDGGGSPVLIDTVVTGAPNSFFIFPEVNYDGSKVVYRYSGKISVNGSDDITPFYYHKGYDFESYYYLSSGDYPQISGDGRYVFFESHAGWNCKWTERDVWASWVCATPERYRLWRVPSGGGEPTIVLDLEASHNGYHSDIHDWHIDYAGTTITTDCNNGSQYGTCVFKNGHFYGFVNSGQYGFSQISPDGNWLVSQPEVVPPTSVNVLKLDGSQSFTFDTDFNLFGGYSHFMSDNAGKFVYKYNDALSNCGDDLWLMNRDGSGRVKVVDLSPDNRPGCLEYSLSYSGQDIAFVTHDDLTGNGNNQYQVFTRLGPPLPDLNFAPFILHPENIILNSGHYILPVDVTLQNVGEASVSDVAVRFSANDGRSSTQTVAELGTGISTTLHLDWDITDLLTKGQGASTVQLTVEADPDSLFTEKTHLNNRYTASTTVDVRPKVQVQPELTLAGHYFLAGANIDNRIRVNVDWNGDLSGNGDPGKVYFNLNGTQVETDGQPWGAERTYNMGGDFESNYLCANNTLRIFATSPTGFYSLESVIQPTVLPAPAWWEWIKTSLAGGYYSFSGKSHPPLVKYTHEYKYPVAPFVANWDVPAWVPYLGGKPMGILQTQASATLTSWSNGAGASESNGQTGFQVGGFGIMGQIYGDGETQFICGQSLVLKQAAMNLKITGLIEEEEGLTDIIPGFKTAENWAIIGRYVKMLNRVAKIKGRLMPGVNIKTSYETRDGELKFNANEGTAFVATQAVFEVTPFKDLMLDVYGGGKPYLTVAVPADPDYFKAVGIQLYYGADIRVFSFQQTFEYPITCSYPGGCVQPRLPAPRLNAESKPAWQFIPRKNINITRLQPNSILQSTATTTETVLADPIYIYPQPALAVASNGTRLLTYVDDDLNDPTGRSTEIMAQLWDGTWQGALPLTNDQQPDFAPAVAFDGSGNGLAIWEHSTLATTITPTLDITFAQSLEIAASVWMSDTAMWSNAITLTHNNLMDYAPELSTGSDGSVMALWESSDGTDMMGTVTHPLTITYAIWDGANWSSPAPALTGLHDVSGVTFAVYSATRAALVYAVDSDGVLTTTNDSDLYYSTFDGSAWRVPIIIADSQTLADTNPALAYDSAGNRHLLWLRDGNLVWLKNSWNLNDVHTVRADSTAAGFLGFTLSRAPDGNLSVVWQTMDENGSNLAYSIFDAAHDSWGNAQPLLNDSALEGSHTVAFADNHTLYLGYPKTETNFITKTLTTATETFTVTNVPTPGNSSLVFLEHTVGQDLTFDSLTLSPSNPAPGAVVTLTAVLQNAGDLAIVNPQVAFYDGATAIGTQTLSLTMTAGSTETLQQNWTLSAAAVSHTFKAVADPNAQISESDETNNEISTQSVLPDLQPDVVYTSHNSDAITVTARLANTGVLTATAPFSVAFRVANPLTGTLLGTVAVEYNIAANANITVTLILSNPTALANLGNSLWVIVDAENAVLEADEENNIGVAQLAILPDLMLTASDITAVDGPAVITIHNNGVITATTPGIAVWQDGLTGTLVYSGTLNTLAAGASETLTLPSVVGEVELWASIDPNQHIAESDESNNLAIHAMTVAYRIYLPLVMK